MVREAGAKFVGKIEKDPNGFIPMETLLELLTEAQRVTILLQDEYRKKHNEARR